MSIAVDGPSALAIVRALRTDKAAGGLPNDRCPLHRPDPAPFARWSRAALGLGRFHDLLAPSKANLLHVAVPRKADRLRLNCTSNSIFEHGLPDNSFIPLGDGLSIPCPELLFLEMDRYMGPLPQLMLGLELCGTFSRDARNPLEGEARLGITPVTSADKIREYAATAGLRGHDQSRMLAECLADNAWSPGEALVAAWAALPFTELGYGMGPIELNMRVPATGDLAHFADKGSRVPDILLAGTKVGLNYDGEGHPDLDAVVSATSSFERDPGSAQAERELRSSQRRVREKYVDDRRRDRELGAAGYTVFVATKEDLYERGALDRLMGECLVALRDAGVPGLDAQIATIRSRAVAGMRHKMFDEVLVGRGSPRAML